jgi:hypothetical protein
MPTTVEHLTGLIERVTFHNAETGFAVMQVKVAGDARPGGGAGYVAGGRGR